MNVKTYKLKYPVSWGKDSATVIEELTFRRPKGKDVYHISAKPTNEDMAKLAGKLIVGDAPTVIIGELDIEDYQAVMDIVGNFIDPSPATGETLGQ